jgi:F0F1-type ATP synthase delta subunit
MHIHFFSWEKYYASNYCRFSKLRYFLSETTELTEYLNSPVVGKQAKRDVLAKILKSQINTETFKFLMVLVSQSN